MQASLFEPCPSYGLPKLHAPGNDQFFRYPAVAWARGQWGTSGLSGGVGVTLHRCPGGLWSGKESGAGCVAVALSVRPWVLFRQPLLPLLLSGGGGSGLDDADGADGGERPHAGPAVIERSAGGTRLQLWGDAVRLR